MGVLMSHYFQDDKTLGHDYQTFTFSCQNITLSLTTDRGVFSRDYVDFGTRVLLNYIEVNQAKNILDLGCGYGPIGLFIARLNGIAKVTLSDVNERVLGLVENNAKHNNIDNVSIVHSDAFSNINDMFDLIVTNPPIRAGKEKVFEMYEGAYEHLVDEGVLYVVIQKKQGAPSSVKKLEALFGNCQIVAKEKGYWVLLAKK